MPTIPAPASPTMRVAATPTQPQTTPVQMVDYEPAFEPSECKFTIPEGYKPDCGYVVVPENRFRQGSPTIRLHVAVFRSTAKAPLDTPVVHLAGGPGSSSLGLAGYMFRQGIDAVLSQQDLILFDQRGTGFSRPRLDCPERDAVTSVIMAQDAAFEVEQQMVVDAFRMCRQRLEAEGNDLSAYNSAHSAADVNDLRIALGYPALDLYGVSYGTRLALTVMRDFPQAVQSAVLDSAYPLQVNLYTNLAPNANRAYQAFFALCEADPGCNSRYSGLESSFYALVDELNANPVSVSLPTSSNPDRIVRLDGGLLIDVLFVGLYNPAVTASMPKMITDIRQDEYSILRDRLRLYFGASSGLGMQMSVQCSEELSFNSPEEAFQLAENVRPQIAAFFPFSAQTMFLACAEWFAGIPDQRENAAVQSVIPTLILVGELDPITPPEWGELLGGDLVQAQYYRFPGNGHWVMRSSGCALDMALAFWANPTAQLDPICLDANDGIEYPWW